MIPKLILSTVVTLGAAHASSMTGFFVSGNAGAMLIEGEHTLKNSSTGQEGSRKVNKMGYHAGPGLGYLMAMGDGKFYVGGELYYWLMSGSVRKELQTKTGPVEGTFTIQPKHAMGAAVLMGTMINPKVMMYARVGYESQSFDFKYDDLTFQSPTNVKYSKSVTGVAPGAGILYRLSTSTSVGIELVMPMLAKAEVRKPDNSKRGFAYTPSQKRITAKVIYSF
jgi:opacity protein-like surface antigen